MNGAVVPVESSLPAVADPWAMRADFLRLGLAASDATERVNANETTSSGI